MLNLNTDVAYGGEILKLCGEKCSANVTSHTLNRKRRHSCNAEDVQLLPQAKRLVSQPFFPELGRDAWDSEVRLLISVNS